MKKIGDLISEYSSLILAANALVAMSLTTAVEMKIMLGVLSILFYVSQVKKDIIKKIKP